MRYRIGDREKLISLGIYPDVPLKRAREKRDEARRLVADEIDPSVERKAIIEPPQCSARARCFDREPHTSRVGRSLATA